MECTIARNWLFRKLDEELSLSECEELDRHLESCDSCGRELRLLLIPRRLGQAIPALEPSPFFYQKLKARIKGEAQPVTIWQIIMGLSRQVLPAMAAITLALLSVFAYFEFRGPEVDLYQAYDSIFFMSTDHPQRMVIAEQDEITNESVFLAISEQAATQHLSASPEVQGK